MTLGKLIKKAREAKGMTLEGLGDAMGVSRQLVWQWERDQSDPRKHIEKLAEHLNVSVDYFYHPKPGSVREAKISRLSPTHQELIDRMIETLLEQQEAPDKPPARKKA